MLRCGEGAYFLGSFWSRMVIHAPLRVFHVELARGLRDIGWAD